MKNKKLLKSLCCLMALVVSTGFFQYINLNAAETKTEWNFDYTGQVEEWTAPYTGKYFLEIYGAAHRQDPTVGNGAGYGRGYINLVAGQKLYICVGQEGKINGPATYNGGGAGGQGTTSGSGATSITTVNRGELYNFKDHKDEVLLVSGGSGGAGSIATTELTNGGGPNGTGDEQSEIYGSPWGHGSSGGTQVSGYEFGKGQDYNPVSIVDSHNCGGYAGAGGGGWYGGTSGKCGYICGGGGSGYMNKDKLYEYQIESSGHDGNGTALIRYEGEVYSNLVIDLNEKGSYDGQEGKVTIVGKYGETVPLHAPVSYKGYTFVGYKKMYGNINPDLDTFTFGFEDAYI